MFDQAVGHHRLAKLTHKINHSFLPIYMSALNLCSPDLTLAMTEMGTHRPWASLSSVSILQFTFPVQLPCSWNNFFPEVLYYLSQPIKLH